MRCLSSLHSKIAFALKEDSGNTGSIGERGESFAHVGNEGGLGSNELVTARDNHRDHQGRIYQKTRFIKEIEKTVSGKKRTGRAAVLVDVGVGRVDQNVKAGKRPTNRASAVRILNSKRKTMKRTEGRRERCISGTQKHWGGNQGGIRRADRQSAFQRRSCCCR